MATRLILKFFIGWFAFVSWCSSESRRVEVTWLGVAGFKITDGNTTLVFDPVFTKPSLSHWLFNNSFFPNSDNIKLKINESHLERVEGIFSSHCHFDHAIDVGVLAEETGAAIYGGDCLEIISKFFSKRSTTSFVKVADQSIVSIGEFKIIFFQRSHAAIFNFFHFLPGKVSPSFRGAFYDFKEGEVWSYRVEHPLVKFIVDQGSHFHQRLKIYSGKTDVYLLGIANRKSIDDLVENNIMEISPKVVIPSHFDFFLLDWDWTESLNLPFNNLEGIRKMVTKKSVGKIKFLIPQKWRPIVVSP